MSGTGYVRQPQRKHLVLPECYGRGDDSVTHGPLRDAGAVVANPFTWKVLELRTLGTLSLRDDSRSEDHALIVQNRRLALLCYLALSPGMRRRDSLIAMFWPDADTRHGRAALRQAMHVLRHTLGNAVVVRGMQDVGIDAAVLQCDVHQLDTAAQAGRHMEVLLLHRGPFLDGFFVADAPNFERWVSETRGRIERTVAASAWSLARKAAAERDVESAKFFAYHAMSVTPDDEEAFRRLLLTLLRVGDRAGAIHEYERFSDRMHEEYHIEPQHETSALISSLASSLSF